MLIFYIKIILICLILTILIEILGAYILKVKERKDYANIILVNVLTNPLVVTITFYINIVYGLVYRNIILFVLEVLVIFSEGFIYKKYLKFNKINPYILSFMLNTFSFVIGEIFNYIVY